MRTTVLLCLTLIFSLTYCGTDDPTIAPDNFWESSTAQAENIHVDSLAKAVLQAADLSNFYALLVIRNGKIVSENYYKGKNSQSVFQLRSVTKNFTSAITGIAQEQGFIGDIQGSIQPFFSEKITGDKQSITIAHLLNMSSGFAWDENGEVIDLIEHRILEPTDYLLNRHLSDAPGTLFNYNSLSPHLVADVIVQTTGMSLEAYANQELLTPLGISDFRWNRDPQGKAWAGFGLQLKARDLARFGLLYLNNGIWNGKQLVPEAWVKQSSVAQIDVPGSSSKYSYQWWIASNLDTPTYFGMGYGGQALMLVPEYDLMIIGFQEHLVSLDQHKSQWNAFINQVFTPIYQGVE